MSLENSFKKAYNDMGGLTFNVANLGSMLDFVVSTYARNNPTGQLAKNEAGIAKMMYLSNKLSNAGILEINIGSNGITGQFGTGGINLGGAMYDLAKRGIDYTQMQMMSNPEAKDTALTAYGWGDWTAENTAMRIASGLDTLVFDEKLDGYGHTVQNSTGNGRTITIKDNGDVNMNAIRLQHEAYRDGIVTADNYLETRTATLAHTEMALRMMNEGLKINDKNITNDINAYSQGRDFFNAYVDENYDSSSDYWKLVIQDNVALFEWDGKYTFDLSAIGIEGRVDNLSEEALRAMYNIGHGDTSFDDFRTAVDRFYTLNKVMQTFETALNVKPNKTMSNDTFFEHRRSFFNALQNVGSSGLLAEKAENIMPIEGQNVFANGGGALTSSYGWRIINGTFQWHNAWDLGARGSHMLVAPMDGSLTLTFDQRMGVQLITSGGNNETITYSHSHASTIRNFVDLYSTAGIRMTDNGQLTGISQNMVIGVMGNTGKLSGGAHVDIIYRVNGVTQNPAAFFYQHGNNVSFPITDYARLMSGLSTDPVRNNLQLTNNQVSGIYNYYNSINSATAVNNFLKTGTASNNYYQFVQNLTLIQGSAR